MAFIEGSLLKMVENEQTPGLLSVHILLPESVARRLERRTQKLPGASWPAWGGHITLVPNFAPQGTLDEVRGIVMAVCAERKPFAVRLAAPISVRDTTRPDYCAVFLTIEDQDETEPEGTAQRDGELSGEGKSTDGQSVDGQSTAGQDTDGQSMEAQDGAEQAGKDQVAAAQDNAQYGPLYELREALLTSLEPLRKDIRPELLEQPFLPHVTLALGLGETEASRLVRAMNADPLAAEFDVDTIWLVRQTLREEKRYERYPVPLGGVARAELLRD